MKQSLTATGKVYKVWVATQHFGVLFLCKSMKRQTWSTTHFT